MTIDLSGGVSAEREFVLAEKPAIPETRDAVNVWIEDDKGAFGMRIGIEAVAEEWDAHEIWLDIAFADGRVLSARERFTPHSPLDDNGNPAIRGSGPLRFQCVKPFTQWTATFKGTAAETTTQELIDEHMADDPQITDVEFDIEMNMAAPPWVPGSLLPEADEVLNKGEEGGFMSPRYEQLFRAKGTLKVGGKEIEFTAGGLRIRRQGVRKFEGFNGHCWASAVFPSGKAFGFNIYPPRPDGKPTYAEGYIYSGEGALIPARIVQAPWLTELRTGGDTLSIVLETADGKVAIDGVTFVNTRSRGHKVLPANFPIVQQAHARYSWDGETASGMLERSSTPDKIKR